MKNIKILLVAALVSASVLSVKTIDTYAADNVQNNALKNTTVVSTVSKNTMSLLDYKRSLCEWKCEVKDESIVEVVKQNIGNMTASGALEMWGAKGLKEGTTEVEFNYISKEDDTVENTAIFSITVDSDLNVTVKEKKDELKEPECGLISLHGNETTGYQWRYKIDDKSIAEIQKKDSIPDDPTGTLDGAGEIDRWSVKGLKEGTTEVIFNYSRPWEDEKPDKTITYVITVDSDLNATVKEKNNTVPSNKDDSILLNVEENDSESSNQINPVISIENKSDKSIDLSKVTLKYYYTADDDKDEAFQCYYSGTTNGDFYTNFTSYVNGKIKKIKPDENKKNVDRCLEIRFSDGILASNQSMIINTCVHKTDWSSYDRTNDYSFKNKIGTEFVYR